MPTIQRAGDAVAFLAKLIKLANSNIQFDSKVGNFLSLLSWELGLEKAILMFLNREKKELVPHIRPGEDILIPTEPLNFNQTFFERAISNRQSLLAEARDLESLSDKWREFFTPFLPCLAVVPIVDDKTCYGTLIILSSSSKELDSGLYGQMVESVANQLSVTIKHNQLATDTRKRISVLNVLSDLGKSLAQTIEVEKVMSMIPQIAAGVFIADGCALNVLDENGLTLLYSSIYGLVPPAYNYMRYQGQTLPLSVALALKRESPYAGFMQNDPKAPELTAKEQLNTICSVPLTFQGPHQGNISLFNKMGGHRGGLAVNPQPFDREDMELLQAMNSIISGVVENAVTFKKVESLYSSNEEMVRYLSNLYDISSAMLTTVRYDELVWIIIKALTLKQGLGFDKVLILLNEGTEEEPVLVSSAFWATAQVEDSEELREPLVEVLRRPSRAEASKMVDSGLKIALSIPVTADSNRILARVITEKKPLLGFRGIDAYDDLDLGDFGSRAYAAVPMLAKGREVGVIAVDRSVSGEPLTASSLRDLTMLANQAGLAIENTRLYDEIRQSNVTLTQVRNRLIEAEKLAAQGEMGTQLAHEIRNPLVSIGGFTQRVLKKMDPEDPLRKYVVVILEEVERLNGVLNNVLDFSRDEQGLIRKFYLQDVAEEAIKSLKHEMERTNTLVKTDYEADLPKVLADDRQVMHVFLNLIANASQAMAPNGGTVYVKIYQYKENETLYAACQITDTGPGIAEQLLPNIFNPFFTTKTKGTGLGLSIVKKIIERYNGQIACANRPEGYSDGGASFTFMFPAAT